MINDLISIFKSSATRKQLIETNGEYILNEICSYAKITEGLNDEFILEAEFEILAPVKKEIYDLLTHENILKVPDEYGDEFFTIFDIYKTADYICVIAPAPLVSFGLTSSKNKSNVSAIVICLAITFI